jgi:nucleoside-diphosphate-sugar epimerase
MKVLLTGNEGYLGYLLVGRLLAAGHQVTGVDTGFYRAGFLYGDRGEQPHTLVKDIRQLERRDLEGHDAVVHFAELSNDPAGELIPEITFDINHRGTIHLAELARAAGVRRFVYASSCSVYGVADGDEPVNEESPVNPQTSYAFCKTYCERDLKAMAGDDFVPVFLRNATAFGASPRQRFDLVLNNLAGWAFTTGEIKMISDGTPWRPLVHALDIAKAVVCALEAPAEAIRGEIFNVGSNSQNYRVRDIAEIVGRVFPGCSVSFGSQGSDNRSYKVSFDKIHGRLPGYSCDWDAEKGARQLLQVFQSIELTRADFEQPSYTRLKQLQYLLRTRQIDQRFFWQPISA